MAELRFSFIGFREHQTEYYGAKCGVCGETMEKRTRCMYNPITKEFRHYDCHINHPDNLTEIWLVDKIVTDEETCEPVTKRTVILSCTAGIELGRAQYAATGVTLLERLEAFPKGAKNPIQARRYWLDTLRLKSVPL